MNNYIQIYKDVLDPSYAPGTGGLEPGGLSSQELLRAVRMIISNVNVVGMDVSEVAPIYDGPAGITSVVANRVVMEAISALANKRKRGEISISSQNGDQSGT